MNCSRTDLWGGRLGNRRLYPEPAGLAVVLRTALNLVALTLVLCLKKPVRTVTK